ncbi:MAG: hypothetical protein ACD_31C00005G0078 [uncultured bacterium]|uniref:DUF2079 domain-containing protein n=3 Tax=Candidatus Daviesiibacteriota TaxID=1752718 RepID=A0A0G0I2N9_9BACT|nr:MAG: hypothetical protein ACD_31C00005G0078 [uncultured bacterium]KKQ10371.1 MAG: hypothetical protein US19_C0006G0013 [Candidatus Daviesbacteria bacterium GW2011_GWB1_36_5]KKQ15510.1 MAG: hypothetical protein US28_C0015G0011 [Candidatus Daviesbacteria bacterium GW2011_GWA1_36_8]OGE17801.1 MAG: hypothetical protein A2858_03590 [Candidatus Daviesbacteria bacterium RIFCSPHIGHO2_01_FULL_36_37]
MKKIQNLFLANFSLIIVLSITLYTIVAITVSLNRYWQYQSFYFDFGIFDSAIWRVSRFELPLVDHPHFDLEKKIIFADHFNPSLFLLSPLYWITDRREVLLLVQSFFVGLSAFIGYKISIKIVKNKLIILALIISYLGYVGMQNALISDFHEATILTLPLMVLFWAVLNKKWLIYFISLFIILGLKETFAGLGVGLALFLLIYNRKYWKYSLLTLLLSITWALISTRIIIPYFSDNNYFYQPVTEKGNIIANLFYPDTKLKTIFYTYLSFGFLPILDLSLLPAILEHFLERFVLSSDKRWDLGLHYNAPLASLMFISSIFAVSFLEKRLHTKYLTVYGIFIILAVLFLHRFHLRGPLGLFFNPVFYEQNQKIAYVDRLINQSPKNGLIMTQNDLALRLSHTNVMLLRKEYEKIKPNYVILNLTPGQNPNSFYPLSYEDAIMLKDRLLEDSAYNYRSLTEYQFIFERLNE